MIGRSIDVQGIGKGALTTKRRMLVKVTFARRLVYEFELWVLPHNAGVDVVLGVDFMIPAGVRLGLYRSTAMLPGETTLTLRKSKRMEANPVGRREVPCRSPRGLRVEAHGSADFSMQKNRPPAETHALWVRRTEKLIPTLLSNRRGDLGFAAEQSKPTKKRHASRSPHREALETEVDPYNNLFASDSEEEEEEGAVNEPRRSRTISTGSRRTSKLPSECRGVLRRGPICQVTTARLLAKEEHHTRESIGFQSLAPLPSSTWSSSLLLVGSLEDTPARVRTSAPWCSGTRCSRRPSRLPGACFSHRTEFL
ncbi:hypothetical protein PC128_g8136 [Phytophthora cactorum]|nr:hypothetical protein PC128_g8136 [Phytophthora cactorum]